MYESSTSTIVYQEQEKCDAEMLTNANRLHVCNDILENGGNILIQWQRDIGWWSNLLVMHSVCVEGCEEKLVPKRI